MESTKSKYAMACEEQSCGVAAQRLGQNQFVDQDLTEKEGISQQLKSLLCIRSLLTHDGTAIKETEPMANDSILPGRIHPDDGDAQLCTEGEGNKYKGISSSHTSDNSKLDSESSNSSGSICYKNDKSLMCDEDLKFVPPSYELAAKILKQTEDVFSDFNILKDTFLQKHIRRSKDGYISVRFLASFRKVKALTKDWQDVKYSLQKSEKLMLNENGTKVRRVDPIPDFKDTTYAKIVIVFNLSADKIKPEDVQELMLLYGDIVSVSIVDPSMKAPEICSTCFLTYFEEFVKDKFFAIVEFQNYESAEAAASDLKNENNIQNQIKVVPLISDEYRNPSKPSSRRKTSSMKEKKGTSNNLRAKRSTRNNGKQFSQTNKNCTSEAEVSSNSSDSQCNVKANRFRNADEDTEFVPPSDDVARKIMEQAEDWFSDFSIFKTTFLLNHIRRSKDGFISVKLVASSRKLRALAKDWRAVQYSMRKSKKLELNERGTKVRRNDPIPRFEDTTYAKTVVVFNLPFENADPENVHQLMSHHGTIMSVIIVSSKSIIPNICTNRFLFIHSKFVKNKSFAIIEYQEYASAVNAISELENVSDDDDMLKVVFLMSDAYKKRSTPSSSSKASKSSKTGISSNESRTSKGKSQSGNRRRTPRKHQARAETETRLSAADKDPKLKPKPSKATPSLPTRRSGQASVRSYQNKVLKSTEEKSASYANLKAGSEYQESRVRGSHPANALKTTSPTYRIHSNQGMRQNSPNSRRGSKFTNSPAHSYFSNNMDPYWESNLPFALDNRMCRPRAQYNDPPPYPGNILNMQSQGNRWPSYPDTGRRFCGRSQNDPYWLNRSDLLSREYERWQAEFNNAAQFSMISSPM